LWKYVSPTSFFSHFPFLAFPPFLETSFSPVTVSNQRSHQTIIRPHVSLVLGCDGQICIFDSACGSLLLTHWGLCPALTVSPGVGTALSPPAWQSQAFLDTRYWFDEGWSPQCIPLHTCDLLPLRLRGSFIFNGFCIQSVSSASSPRGAALVTSRGMAPTNRDPAGAMSGSHLFFLWNDLQLVPSLWDFLLRPTFTQPPDCGRRWFTPIFRNYLSF